MQEQKRTPVVVESDAERPGSDSDTDDGVPVRQKKKGRTVCKEKRIIKTRKKHIIGMLMAENE